MRFLALFALAASIFAAAPADAQRRGHAQRAHSRDQDAAYHAMQQGQILPLNTILSRVRVRGAQYIGADLDPTGSIYRLTFMRGGDVIRLHVNARTGQPLGISR